MQVQKSLDYVYSKIHISPLDNSPKASIILTNKYSLIAQSVEQP